MPPQAAIARSTPTFRAPAPSPGPQTPIGTPNAPPRLRAGAPGVPKAGETPPSEAADERSRPHTPPRRPPRSCDEYRKRATGQLRPGPVPPRPSPVQPTAAHRRESAHVRCADDPEDPPALRIIARWPVANRLTVHSRHPTRLRVIDALQNQLCHRKTRVLCRVPPRTRKRPQILRRVRRPRNLHRRRHPNPRTPSPRTTDRPQNHIKSTPSR